MDALILAAGFGSRLGDLGQHTPKALLEVGGRTMLEHVVDRLVAAGVDRVVVNVHHHADLIERFVDSRELGAEILLSHEPERPLETGGGLLNARGLLRRDAPFFLHNVDVLTEADLSALRDAHVASGALATLAVSDRPTQRHLLFDEVGLVGWSDGRRDVRIEVRGAVGEVRKRAFAGIHVLAPELPDRITEQGVFSILDVYFRLAREGARIDPVSIGEARWLEVGTPERLEAARAALATG